MYFMSENILQCHLWKIRRTRTTTKPESRNVSSWVDIKLQSTKNDNLGSTYLILFLLTMSVEYFIWCIGIKGYLLTLYYDKYKEHYDGH